MLCLITSGWPLSRIPPLISEIDKTRFKGRYVLIQFCLFRISPKYLEKRKLLFNHVITLSSYFVKLPFQWKSL